MAEHCCKWLEITENGWDGWEMLERDENSWKCLEISGNGLGLARKGWNGW